MRTKYSSPRDQDFVRVAADVCAHGDQRQSRLCDPNIKVDVEDQIRNFLNGTSDRKLGAELFRKIGVAATTRLKIRLVCLRPRRSNVDNFKFARAFHERAQLIAKPRQAGCFIRRGPFVAPSRLVSINSKSKIATRRPCDCAEIGQRTQKMPKSPMSARVMRAS